MQKNYEKKIGELNSFISEIASESKYQELKNELETKKSQEFAKLNEKRRRISTSQTKL
ncbi:hypothetical protein V2E25_00630 [Mycoplasmopsis arginini]|uniref:Uncharacterized protein n=1 Tax=Mycoplasmopsis arginini TaxID=2094 RepID=A0ABZ2AJ99_MYCAR|nr:hypothetical protein [Mycoplasmopsis arginini]WVN22095.1 hypothetical protein V2E25_00630 [Mycoplasmopsis arginini]VEU81497.1 Uncharacterised protein [Mycoplasmopsis arginini]